MQRGTAATVGLVLVLLGALAGVTTVAAADGRPADTAPDIGETDGQTVLDSETQQQSDDNTIVVRQEYRLTPDQPGRICRVE